MVLTSPTRLANGVRCASVGASWRAWGVGRVLSLMRQSLGVEALPDRVLGISSHRLSVCCATPSTCSACYATSGTGTTRSDWTDGTDYNG